MNNEQQQLLNKIRKFSFDKPNTCFTFSQRLAKENGWNIEYTHRAIAEYRKFVFLAVVAGHIVTPSEQVDRVWHLHLTYTHSYWHEFCPHILGKSLHHQPTEGGKNEQVKYYDLYCQTLNSYAKFFGNQPPEDIWSSPEKRFSQDLAFKLINVEDNWIIPKPNLSAYINNITNKIDWRLKQTGIVIASVFLGLLILLGGALPSLANYAPFYWDFINETLNIQDNGDLLVTEEQKYVFTDVHSPEHYRFINLDKLEAIKDVQVFEDQHLLPIRTFTQGNKFWIKWHEYLDDVDTHTFTLKYRVIGAVNNISGKDKLEWKAIFPKRDAPINNAEIVIKLPESLIGKVENYYIIGGDFQKSFLDDNTIKFASLRSLLPGESSKIKVTFIGNLLNLDDVSSLSYKDISFLVVLLVFAVSLVAIISILSNTVFRGSKAKNNSTNSSDDSGYYGGCGGFGGGGSGCGGGCGGGG